MDGEIPEKGQFHTFPPTSFQGKMDLYYSHDTSGFVLSPSDETCARPHHQKLEIIGFPFGFGGVAGFLQTAENNVSEVYQRPQKVLSPDLCRMQQKLLSSSFGTSTLESQNFISSPNDLKALTGFSSCLESAIPDWSSSTFADYCTWSGVTCDNKLSGSLSEGLGKISKLVDFDISSNEFYGILPNIFGSLRRLKFFSTE
ncbi:hypothetical protein JHK87_018855 [Glycine soja]|nr:hypothetical protein JHK87_018855 [Glycine soja]